MKSFSFFPLLAVISLMLCLPPTAPGQGTFTVHLPKMGDPPDEEGQGWSRPRVWGRYHNDATDDSIIVPNGRPIYALFVSGFGSNADFDMLHFYNFARHLQAQGAYVHYAWWNNLLAEYMKRPLHFDRSIPGNAGELLENFRTPEQAEYKAIPGEDYQFLADAKRFLSAIRQNNPDAIIIVVGHSMGGGAVVHLGSQTNVRIDILAPIDPVGNRNFPWRFAPLSGEHNWTRWRVTRDNFLGWKPRGLLCHPYGPWRPEYHEALLRNLCWSQGHTPGPLHHAAPTLRFRSNIVHLYHRWQGEFFWPLDYYRDYWFQHNRPPGGSTSQSEIRTKGGGFDPGGWPESDPSGNCCPMGSGVGWPRDGHGEIVGSRGPIPNPPPLGALVRTSESCGTSCDTLVWPTDPGPRSRELRQLENLPLDSTWVHSPHNPDLCLVSEGLIRLFDRINGPGGVPGIISGKVAIDGIGVAPVTVKILDDEDPTDMVDVQTTDESGDYSFGNVQPGRYQVMIEEPLGYEASQNNVQVTLAGGENVVVNFELAGFIMSNSAKGKGYWKHQFSTYVNGRGRAQETRANLESYIGLVASRYNPRFSIFHNAVDDSADFQDWLGILSVAGNEGMVLKATSHLAAAVLNIMSLKLAQYQIVTEDSITAGDVLTYVSTLIDDEDPSNDELAKDLAERMNEKQIIPAGLVPPSGMLYRSNGRKGNDGGDMVLPQEFSLEQNYPNPFNPSTQIKFALPQNSHVRLTVFNPLGQEVARLVDEARPAGRHEITWNAASVASGVYFYKIEAYSNNGERFLETRKMLLLK